MLVINVKKYDGDYFQTRINATIEEVAHYYFPISEIKEIEILQGGDEETDSYGIFYKGTEETKKMSCGLVRI